MRVLLLEDEATLQRATSRMIRRTFSPTEITIDVVDSVPKAVAMLQHFAYDLVVSDFNVNGGTGGDLLIWIRANRPHMVERFVFFSGANHLDLWHNKIIAKGVDPSEFVEKLRGYVTVA